MNFSLTACTLATIAAGRARRLSMVGSANATTEAAWLNACG